MQKITLLFALLFTSLTLHAQPNIQWQKCLGGTLSETARDIQQTSDDGYIVVGYTRSNDGDVFGFHGGWDWWVVKLDQLGNIQWKKVLGGSDIDTAESIRQTCDGGYIIAGSTYSNNWDVSGNHGESDYWVAKLSPTGQIQWRRAYGGSGEDNAYAVRQTTDGGYIVAGYSGSLDGDVTHKVGIHNVWIVKLDSAGTIEWNRSYGGLTNGDLAYSIEQTTDGGYIFAGETYSNDGDVSGHHGNDDCWVVKITAGGEIEWQRALGGMASDRGWRVLQTTDGGYAMLGYAGSSNGDVVGWHGLYDYWVVKLSTTGEIEWQKCLGGTDDDWARSICQTADGGYAVVGITRSTDGDVLYNSGQDIWVVQLDSTGVLQWQKTLGGTDAEWVNAIIQTHDGGLAIAGETYSIDGDVSGNHGDKDIWVVKLAPVSVGTEEARMPIVDIYPNPTHDAVSVQVSGLPDGEPLLISVNNLQGRGLIRQTLANGQRLDIGALPAGMYILTAVNESGILYSGKITKTN